MTFQQFQEEYEKAKQRVPRNPNHSLKCENADYGDNLYYVKNAHYCFEDAHCEDIIYIFDSFKAKDCCDGDYIVESELCYECVDTVSSYNCSYLMYSSRMQDSSFCWDCMDSSYLFGCAYLRHKKYCIFNKQYSKEEYEKKVADLKKRTPEENFKELQSIIAKFPITQTSVEHSENCDYGNQIFHSKNLYLCFDSAHTVDSGYLYDSHHNISCYDMTQSHHSELSYECNDATDCNNCHHLNYCDHMVDSAFCENSSRCTNVFGCVGLREKQYCFLNKQYTKEEYDKKVVEVMNAYTQ